MEPRTFLINRGAMLKVVWQRYGLAVGLLVLVGFKFWLVHTEDIYGSATEYDALWYVNAAKNWFWWSPYSWTAFARPPAYALFVAVAHLCSVPLRIAIELLQIGAYVVLVFAFRKAGVARSVCLLAFAVMVLHPASFLFDNHTMSDSFYAGVLPLALGGLLLTLLTGKSRHALWTGAILGVLWNTREESILIPAMLGVFFAVALFRQHSAAGSWKAAARYWIKPAASMLAPLALLVLAVDIANYRVFHGFSKSELTSPSFQAAYKALLRIRPSRPQRFISVSTEALEIAYTVSPTFARLKPQLEGDLGRAWQVPAFASLGVHEIAAPWFFWALRNAAAQSGNIHDSAANAERFYRDAAAEINRACDEGRVPTRFVLSTFVDPGALPSLRDLPESFRRIAGLFLERYETVADRDDAILTPSQRALYDEMTGRRAHPPRGKRKSEAVENFIGRYHRNFVAGLSIAGCASLLVIVWRSRRVRGWGALNATLVILAGAILLRVALFSYLDATWWVGGYERYLFPVMPLYSCFLVLLIYQAGTLALRRRSRSVIPSRLGPLAL
ncbi:MAG TPA: hypothetical protein VGW57_10520 [Chthoniobacterales bacterium]|nr:hypothetical protein [Chthoniobacterales bacterium]